DEATVAGNQPRSRTLADRAEGTLDGTASNRGQGRQRPCGTAPLTDAERCLSRPAADRAARRRGLADAVARRGSQNRMVADSVRVLEERRSASCAADATGRRDPRAALEGP